MPVKGPALTRYASEVESWERPRLWLPACSSPIITGAHHGAIGMRHDCLRTHQHETNLRFPLRETQHEEYFFPDLPNYAYKALIVIFLKL